MTQGLQAFFLQRSPWLSIALIVGTSIATSVGVLHLVLALWGEDQAAVYCRLVGIAVVVPAVVSAPIGAIIVHLVRDVDRSRQLAQALAWQDALTGLPNRRRLIEQGERELSIARRSGRPAYAALIDIDDFKLINDRHGHSAGDAVLQAVGGAIKSALRSSDLVARWGGEELAVLLPDTDAHEAVVVAERLRTAVEQLAIRHGDGGALTCTISVGLSQADGDAGFDCWIDRADRAMYLAKAAGKNRVQVG